MNDICVYTAIMGDFDTLKAHPEIGDVDFVAFTDCPMECEGWQVVDLGPSDIHPRLRAKYPKMLAPQQELADYRITIWIDGSLEITNPDFPAEATADLGKDGFALWRHSYRDNLEDELAESLPGAKYAGQPLREQVAFYREAGVPNGLWGCSGMARARSKRLDATMRDWMAENEKWSLQDQISLPYVLFKNQIEPVAWPNIPPSPFDDAPPNPWVRIHSHTRLI